MKNLEIENKEISSQEFVKNGWRLINKRKDKFKYYADIECITCGNIKSIDYYSFIHRNPHKCKKCKAINQAKEEIGQIFGTVEVLGLDHIEEKISSNKTYYYVYYLTRCTKCHKESIRLRNISQWKKTDGCKKCDNVFEESSYNSLYNTYKYGAKTRNINWNLTPKEFLNIITKPCFYCGSTGEERQRDCGKSKLKVNGIDRVNSSLDYSVDNCVPCCTMCNYMKQDYPQKLFINQIHRIHNHLTN